MNRDEHNEYTPDFVAGLEWMWGEGFLSPGGAREVAALLQGVDLSGCHVLDVGCGLGGVDVLLINSHHAARVTGIDIEQPLVERARARAAAAGIDDRAVFQLTQPGPLPFADGSFDVVFSKDSIIHIEDKAGFYRDVLRVLTPGGLFVGSDWLRGGAGEVSTAMQEWLDLVGLSFQMKNLEQTRNAIQRAGFENIMMRDRNHWYRQEMANEIASISGANYARLVKAVGEENAARRLESSTRKRQVVELGELRPTHFQARKPA